MYLGEFRNRVALQTLGGGTDAGGGQATSYSTATTVWARVEKVSGTEGMFGDQLRATGNFKFTIRYFSALTPKHRILYRSKNYNILSVTDYQEGKFKYQDIMAIEGGAT